MAVLMFVRVLVLVLGLALVLAPRNFRAFGLHLEQGFIAKVNLVWCCKVNRSLLVRGWGGGQG